MKLTPADEHFLAAIAAAPDDNAPRLVYSDLLLERRSPWGELIAVQCALADRAARNESRIDDAHAYLLRREYALLATRKTWWADLLGYPNVIEFQRGFPTDVAFESSAELANNARTWLRYFPELTRLRVDLREGEMLRLATIDYLPTRGLMLRPQREPEPGYVFDFLDAGMYLKWIATVAPRLEAFELWGDVEPRALEKLFTSFEMNGVRRLAIGATSIGTALRGCVCHPSEIVFDGARDVYDGIVFYGTRHLSLNNAQLVSSLQAIVNSSVQSISVEGVALRVPGGPTPVPEDIVPDTLTNISGLPASLQSLDVTSSGAGRHGALSFVEGFPELKTFRVGNNNLNDEVACEIARLGRKNLRNISFAKNDIGPRTIESLAEDKEVRGAAPMEQLSLWNTRIGDRGAEIIASSRVFASLERLEISNVGLSKRGALALVNSTHLPPGLRLEVWRSELGADEKEQTATLEALRDRFAVVHAI